MMLEIIKWNINFHGRLTFPRRILMQGKFIVGDEGQTVIFIDWGDSD